MNPVALIVGLGNPGREYVQTRHNLGFMVVEAFAQLQEITLREQTKFLGRMGKGSVAGREIHLLLPSTFMNDSGRAVRKAVDFFRWAPNEVFVVCDDVELSLGTIRVRLKGGSGGHRGLQSVATHLGTQEYPRMRVGVGRGATELESHVLTRFAPEEEQELNNAIERAVQMLQEGVKESVIGETR